MKNKVHAYKLLRVVDKVLLSAIKEHEYKVGELVSPPKRENPFLFIFEHAEDAIRFAKDRYTTFNYELWSVSANNVTKKKEGLYKVFDAEDWPQGTLFCSSLRLKKKIMSMNAGATKVEIP